MKIELEFNRNGSIEENKKIEERIINIITRQDI